MVRAFALLLALGALLSLPANAEPIDDLPQLDRSDNIAGDDEDRNGIRDDIDHWIADTDYTAPQKRALQQLARSHQKAVTIDPAKNTAVRATSRQNSKAVACVFSRFKTEDPALPGSLSRKIEAMTANTKLRLKNYLAYNKALDGTVSAMPDGDTCEE